MSYCVPNSISWSITDRCNLKCKHCYSSKEDDKKYEMCFEEVLKSINILDEYGIFRITLTGGEPLIRKDIFEIINELKKRNFRVEMNTNGTLIDKDIAKKLKEIGINSIRISIDGKNNKSHDEFRGVNGSFSKAVNAVKLLKEAGNIVNVTTVPNKLNKDEVKDIYMLLKKLGISEWHFFRLIPTGCAINNLNLVLSKEEYFNYMKEIKKIENEDNDIKIHFNDPLYNLLSLNKSSGCGAGKYYLGMNTKGDFTLCPSMSYSIGNIFNESIQDIFAKRIVCKARNNSLIKKCSECKYNEFCGGCCSYSYSIYKENFDEDPYCIKDLIEEEAK